MPGKAAPADFWTTNLVEGIRAEHVATTSYSLCTFSFQQEPSQEAKTARWIWKRSPGISAKPGTKFMLLLFLCFVFLNLAS